MLSTGIFRLCGYGVTSTHQKEPRLQVILHHTEIWIPGLPGSNRGTRERVWVRYYQCTANNLCRLWKQPGSRRAATCGFGWTEAHGSLPAGQDHDAYVEGAADRKNARGCFPEPRTGRRLRAQTRLCVHFRINLTQHPFLPALLLREELRSYLRLGASRWRESGSIRRRQVRLPPRCHQGQQVGGFELIRGSPRQ